MEQLAFGQVSEHLILLLGILCVMMTPMVFGAITAIKSIKASKPWWADNE